MTNSYTSIEIMTNEQIQINANLAKQAFLFGLLADKQITQEQCDYMMNNYVIVIHKKGFFGELVDGWLGKTKEDRMTFECVKLLK